MNPELHVSENQASLEILKSSAMNINGLALADGKVLDDLEIAPGTYNENQEVIVFAIGDQKYAMPANSQARSYLEQAQFRKEESVGVPHLNDADVWGTPERRGQMESFKEWLSLSQKG
jgi:hypothetical protein